MLNSVARLRRALRGIDQMPALTCPQCGSAVIIPGGFPKSRLCPRLLCGVMMERHEDEAAAHAAIRKAVYSLDLTAEKQAEEQKTTDRHFQEP
jgi:ribosomal protein S27AE